MLTRLSQTGLLVPEDLDSDAAEAVSHQLQKRAQETAKKQVEDEENACTGFTPPRLEAVSPRRWHVAVIVGLNFAMLAVRRRVFWLCRLEEANNSSWRRKFWATLEHQLGA